MLSYKQNVKIWWNALQSTFVNVCIWGIFDVTIRDAPSERIKSRPYKYVQRNTTS